MSLFYARQVCSGMHACDIIVYMIYEKVTEELKEAMKARDSLRVEVMRGMIAGFTNELVAKGMKPQEKVTDEIALPVIKRLAKQRKDSIEQFTKGGRTDLAEKESKELAILETYLPQMMSEDEVKKVVLAKQKELGVTDKSKMGMLIGAVMKELKDKADGNDVKQVVEELFN